MSEIEKPVSNSLLQGSVTKNLIKLATPIVFANILQSAYQLIDTFWVGRLGAEAVAAVSLSFPVIFLIISLGGGLTLAGTILVAQNKGADRQKDINHISTQTIGITILISLVLSAIGYFFSAQIMRLMGAEPGVLPMATSYLKISFVGMTFVFIFFIYQSLMRGIGEVNKPLYIVFSTVLLNLILDPLFILGWGPIPAYGVSGAALATIGTEGVAALVGFYILARGKVGIRLSIKDLKPDPKVIKLMFKLGLPASIEQSARALGFAVMSFLAASFGTLAIASYGIGFRMFGLVVIPALGLSIATSTLVGQSLGARNIERANATAKRSIIISFAVLSVVGIVMFIFARDIVALFVPDDATVISLGSAFIRIMALAFGFLGARLIAGGVLSGSGNTFVSMVLSTASLWGIQLPLAYFLSKHTSLGQTGIWWSFPIANIAGALLGLWWLKKGTWKHKELLDHDKELRQQVMVETEVEEGIQ